MSASVFFAHQNSVTGCAVLRRSCITRFRTAGNSWIERYDGAFRLPRPALNLTVEANKDSAPPNSVRLARMLPTVLYLECHYGVRKAAPRPVAMDALFTSRLGDKLG